MSNKNCLFLQPLLLEKVRMKFVLYNHIINA